MKDLVFQGEKMECGLASLATVSNMLGYNLKLESIRNKIKVTHQGISLESLSDAAEYYKMEHDLVSFNADDLLQMPVPSIIHLQNNHYVVLKHVTKTHAVVLNPAMGKQVVPIVLFSEACSGYAAIFHQRQTTGKNVDKLKLNSDNYHIKYITFGILLMCVNMALPIIINNMSGLNYPMYIIFVMLFLSQFLFYLVAKKSKNLSKSIEMNEFKKAGVELYKILCSNNITFFEKRLSSDIKEKYMSYCSAKSQKKMIFSDSLISLLAAITCFSVSIFLSVQLTIYTVIGLIVTGAATGLFKYSLDHFYYAGQELNMKLSSYLLETFRGVQVIKSSNRFKWFHERYTKKVRDLLQSKSELIDCNFNYRTLLAIVSNIELSLILVMSHGLVDSGELGLDSLLAFLFVRQLLITNVHALYGNVVAYGKISIDLKRGEDLVNYEKDLVCTSNEVEFNKNIELNNVRYSFDGVKNLFDIEYMCIDKGSVYTIFGKSGSGKSTLIRVMSGYYKSNFSATIDKKAVETESMRKMSYLCCTNEVIFEGTILDNISLFSRDADCKRIEKLIKQLGLFEQVNSLPNGLNEIIKEDIHPFSYGEKKRLLLCRALYSDKKVIVLDEPTSNLDDKSSLLVRNALANSGKTIIVATHDERFKDISTSVTQLH